ncbi:hypothetical protein [Paraliomyxa miuraensis]|uniref:hypothetical protein n=1 Tax=Paraliomyxa miuraensis TaxID=376150 RepID=UPI0022570E51|nr:hypothetical protein [Paraliomyxa miuraensis]MCX4241254.1 hypothetical protein [Paraliomyxa miuraensis]
MSKLISFASFAALALTAGLAHAEPPCPGSNGNGCSWTCSGGTYHVTCQNTGVGGLVPRCYDVSGGTTTNVPCNQAPPPPGLDETDNAFEVILEIEDDLAALEEEAGACYEPPKKGKTVEEAY